MKKFYANIVNGKLEMSTEQDRLWKQLMTTFKPTDLVEITIKKYRQPRSNKQLGDWWGLFSKICLAEFEDRGWDTSYVFKLDQPTGIAITADLLKQYMYAVCPQFDDKDNPVTMSNMDTLQMSNFQTDCRSFAATQWNTYIPDPDPNWRIKQNLKPDGR